MKDNEFISLPVGMRVRYPGERPVQERRGLSRLLHGLSNLLLGGDYCGNDALSIGVELGPVGVDDGPKIRPDSEVAVYGLEPSAWAAKYQRFVANQLSSRRVNGVAPQRMGSIDVVLYENHLHLFWKPTDKGDESATTITPVHR